MMEIKMIGEQEAMFKEVQHLRSNADLACWLYQRLFEPGTKRPMAAILVALSRVRGAVVDEMSDA